MDTQEKVLFPVMQKHSNSWADEAKSVVMSSPVLWVVRSFGVQNSPGLCPLEWGHRRLLIFCNIFCYLQMYKPQMYKFKHSKVCYSHIRSGREEFAPFDASSTNSTLFSICLSPKTAVHAHSLRTSSQDKSRGRKNTRRASWIMPMTYLVKHPIFTVVN